MTPLRQMLEHSFRMTRELQNDQELTRLEFLSDFLFDFTTYDSEMSELFARKALMVCAVISAERTLEFIKDPDCYRWYLLMLNMPFFVGRLDWGTSIRGAWWRHETQVLDTSGLWRGQAQTPCLTFCREEWLGFIDAMVDFGAAEDRQGLM